MNIIIFLLTLSISSIVQAYQFQLTDGVTGQTLANTKVVMIRENTIRCESAPCPSNETKYNVVINRDGILDATSIYAKENLGGDLKLVVSQYHEVTVPRDLKPQQVNQLELIPLTIDSTFRQITFYNKITEQPLSGLEVTFSRTEKECTSGECPNVILKAKTNKLGHIYYKFLTLFPGGLAEMNPVWLHTTDYLPYARHHHHSGKVELIPKKIEGF
jgi:hypothetical protein